MRKEELELMNVLTELIQDIGVLKGRIQELQKLQDQYEKAHKLLLERMK